MQKWTVSATYEIRLKDTVPVLVATVNHSDNVKVNGYKPEEWANLIAAAPELLAGLRQSREYFFEQGNKPHFVNYLDEIIAKAEGRAVAEGRRA